MDARPDLGHTFPARRVPGERRVPIPLLLPISLLVFVAFLVRGFTGFGAALLVVPILALCLPVKSLVVPLLTVLSLVNSLWLAWRARERIDWVESAWLFAGSVPGVAVGLLLFQQAPESALRRIVGGCVLVIGAWIAARGDVAVKRRLPRAAAPAFGGASGVVGALFGAGGPPLVLYLAGRGLPREAFRATLLLQFAASDLARSAALATGGWFTPALLLSGLALYPAALLGSWCGERLFQRVSEAAFRRAVGGLLVAVGAVLLVTGGRSH